MQVRSPVSRRYGWRRKVSLDSIVDVTPLRTDCTIFWFSSLIYTLDEPEWVQLITPGAPTDVHFRTSKGFVALVTPIEGVTAWILH